MRSIRSPAIIDDAMVMAAPAVAIVASRDAWENNEIMCERAHYEDRICRLRTTLREIAGGLGPLTTMSIARQAIEKDDELADLRNSEFGED